MISDVLFEALEKIEGYQRDLPFMYDSCKDDIEACKTVMRDLLRRLDTPPTD